MTRGTFIKSVTIEEVIVINKGDHFSVNNGFMVINDGDILVRTGTALFDTLIKSTEKTKKNYD